MKIDGEINFSDLRQKSEKKSCGNFTYWPLGFCKHPHFISTKNKRVVSLTNIYKFTFQKVNLNIFDWRQKWLCPALTCNRSSILRKTNSFGWMWCPGKFSNIGLSIFLLIVRLFTKWAYLGQSINKFLTFLTEIFGLYGCDMDILLIFEVKTFFAK